MNPLERLKQLRNSDTIEDDPSKMIQFRTGAFNNREWRWYYDDEMDNIIKQLEHWSYVCWNCHQPAVGCKCI